MNDLYLIAHFNRAKIVIYPDWYGVHFCFHIDPGDGSTLPIYFYSPGQNRMAKKVHAMQSEYVDIVVRELHWAVEDRSGVKRYLYTIKESNAR